MRPRLSFLLMGEFTCEWEDKTETHEVIIFLVSSPVKRNAKTVPHNSVHVAQNRGMPSQSKTNTYMASANTLGVQMASANTSGVQLHTQRVEHMHT